MKLSPTILLGLLLCILACAKDARPAEIEDDPIRNGVRLSQLRTHPVRSVQYWQQPDQNKAPETRIGPAPTELIDFMHLDNTFQGYSERPIPASEDSEFIRDVEIAVMSLPQTVKVIAGRMLFYIALVRELGGGSGYMDVVADIDGSAAGGFIVLDEGALDMTANAWASWKEESAFQSSADWSLDVQVETLENDTRVNAIRYILLHELGHVIDAVLGVTQIDGGNTQNISSNGFYSLSWTYPPPSQGFLLPGETLRSRFDATWPERETLAFYSFDDSKHNLNDVQPIYEWLRETNFPTLYAATSSADDFAESFANYVHVILDERPFEIRLRNGELAMLLLSSCWDSRICASKRTTMKRLLDHAVTLP